MALKVFEGFSAMTLKCVIAPFPPFKLHIGKPRLVLYLSWMEYIMLVTVYNLKGHVVGIAHPGMP